MMQKFQNRLLMNEGKFEKMDGIGNRIWAKEIIGQELGNADWDEYGSDFWNCW